MRRVRFHAGVGALAAAGLLSNASAARADSTTDVGLLGAIVTGTHVGFGNSVPQSGVVPGAAIEFTERVDRVRLHLEGIPTVAATGSGTGPFGRSSASLSLLNSTVMVDLDAHRYFRVGAGYQLVTLTNKNGNNGDRNDVRIASPIFAAAATLPLRPHRFVETQLLVDPNLRGNLLVFNYLGTSRPSEPEQGAEVDYSAAYGWDARRVTYLVGYRGLSYHTRNQNSGALVDRNVGGGVTFEARFHLGTR
jgi:hypothetical protein